jgi:phosphoribosylglycinamide formyltransferase-1
MQSIIAACRNPDFPARVEVVLSNNPNAAGIAVAKENGIPTVVVNHKDYDSREDFERAIIDKLSTYKLDLICLAGFMRILTSTFVDHYKSKIINTHPALLPKHGGEGMYGLHVHRAVLKSGDKESGVSVHYVIPECDEGPVILQKSVPVLDGDTPETLAARVLEQEHIAYVEAIKMIAMQNKSD